MDRSRNSLAAALKVFALVRALWTAIQREGDRFELGLADGVVDVAAENVSERKGATNWRPEHETFGMKTCSIIIAACLAAGGAAVAQTSSPSQDQALTRISNQTGVSVDTLRKQEAETGLGFGDLEKANLLAKASDHSFREVVSRFKGGEGWGEIAHDAGLNLGKLVSEAHRSDNAVHPGRDEEARDEQDRDEQGRDEQVGDERDRDDRGHGEAARDEQDRDEQGRDEQAGDDRGHGEEARDEQDQDEQGRDEQVGDGRDRDDRGRGEEARDERDRGERATDENGHAQNVAAAQGHHRVLTKISNQTGVPARRLSRQKAKTGLGFGALEKANLLAKATGRSFRQVVSRFRSGEGFGKIAHDAGLNLGKLVSRAHRSDKAAQNAHKTHPQNAQGKSAVARGKNAVAHGKSSVAQGKRSSVAHGNSLQRASTVAHGNNSLQRASAGSPSIGHIGTMNGFGRNGLAPGRGGAVNGGGHGHGGGR